MCLFLAASMDPPVNDIHHEMERKRIVPSACLSRALPVNVHWKLRESGEVENL